MAEALSIVHLLNQRATEHPERIALRFLCDGENVDTELSYGELHARVRVLAHSLVQKADVGERVLLLYHTGPEYVIALLACFAARVIAVPAYPPLSTQPQHQLRVLSIAESARPRLLLTQASELTDLEALRAGVPALRDVQLLATDQLSASLSAAMPLGMPSTDQVALLQYTSGSTSAPKGVVLTHANLLANERVIQQAFSMSAEDVVVSWLPLFHDMGLIGTLLQPLYSGCSAVLLPHQRFMERPRRWLEVISRFGGTVSGAPDFAYRLSVLRSDPDIGKALDLSRWRLAFCGAEPVRASTLQMFERRFRSVGFDAAALYPCYGLAESTLLVAGRERGSGVLTRGFSTGALAAHRAEVEAEAPQLVACGHAGPEHALAIVDAATGEDLAAGAVGEVWVHGPSVAQGYWKDADASAATFVVRGGMRYLRTGDLGFMHEGNLFVTGRAKDLIIVRGQNLYPQDIEQQVEASNEAVRAGRVVAFAVEHQGQEGIGIAAEVNPRLQKFIDPNAVCAGISEVVARSTGEAPAWVVLLQPGSVPLTSSGKLQRAACRAACFARQLPFVASFGAMVEA